MTRAGSIRKRTAASESSAAANRRAGPEAGLCAARRCKASLTNCFPCIVTVGWGRRLRRRLPTDFSRASSDEDRSIDELDLRHASPCPSEDRGHMIPHPVMGLRTGPRRRCGRTGVRSRRADPRSERRALIRSNCGGLFQGRRPRPSGHVSQDRSFRVRSRGIGQGRHWHGQFVSPVLQLCRRSRPQDDCIAVERSDRVSNVCASGKQEGERSRFYRCA